MDAQSLNLDITAKEAGARRYKFKISDEGADRDRDVISITGWDLRSYKKNPVVLYGHNYGGLPIARTVEIQTVGFALEAVCEFPPKGIYPLADTVHDLVGAGFLHAASVGFKPIKRTWNADRSGWDIEGAELLEWSIVPVPANARTLVQRCIGEGCDETGMKHWLAGPTCECAGDDKAAFIEWLRGIPASPSKREQFIKDLHAIDYQPTQIDVPPALIKRVFAQTCADVIKEEISAAVRNKLRYLQGCIDD